MMDIREAIPEDADAISILINDVAHYFTLEPGGKGAERFLESISPVAIRGYIQNTSYNYLVAEQDKDIAGVVAIKERTHLFHLFVAPAFQKKGLARQLWSAIHAYTRPGTSEITVNSTPYAVPVYEKLGFIVTGPRKEINGIAFVPMKMTSE